MEAAPHEAQTLMRETLDAFEPVAAAHGIALTGRVVQGSLLAEFDRERILQVLANLVSNAIKFTPPEGRVSIRIHHENDEIRFSVSDTGVGIAPEELERVFERFRQVRHDRTGLGLGLHISKCIVDENVILNRSRPLLVTIGGQEIPYAESA